MAVLMRQKTRGRCKVERGSYRPCPDRQCSCCGDRDSVHAASAGFSLCTAVMPEMERALITSPGIRISRVMVVVRRCNSRGGGCSSFCVFFPAGFREFFPVLRIVFHHKRDKGQTPSTIEYRKQVCLCSASQKTKGGRGGGRSCPTWAEACEIFSTPLCSLDLLALSWLLLLASRDLNREMSSR